MLCSFPAMIEEKPEILTFEGAAAGPALVVLGAVHGNEKCGPQAINRLVALIRAGKITLNKGTLSVVPVCNPRAYEQDVRFTERNLNRFFYPKDHPKFYEDHLDNILCPVVEKADYLVDLHSYTSAGGAFIFIEDMNEDNLAFARSLGVPRMICGWADALQNNEDVVDKKQAMGTTEYAREHGALALTLECGTHKHPRGADIGFEAVLNVLGYLGMAEIDESLHIRDLPEEGEYMIRMRGVELRLRDGDFLQDWKNMDFVRAGTVIARYDDGEELTMPEDGFIVLPKRDTPEGHEWFFWGVEDE